MSNPYEIYSPVIGDNFYGQDIITDILDSDNLSHAWTIGARRSGKTSLLKQLEYKVLKEKNYSDKYIPIFWDLQGINDSSGLLRRIIQGLWDLKFNSNEMFELLNLDLDSIEKEVKNVDELFNMLNRSIRPHGKVFLILCDEVEAITGFKQEDANSISDLRSFLQRRQTRSIIAATGALWSLREKNKFVSPFLSGFIPPIYSLGSISKNDAISLIRKCHNLGDTYSIPESWEDLICNQTGQIPYYIQMLCREIYNSRPEEFEEALGRAYCEQDLGIILENDLIGLTSLQKNVLLYVVENKKTALKDIKQAKLQKAVENEHVFEALEFLVSLGYIQKITKDTYTVQNYFMRLWYSKNLREIVECDMNGKNSTKKSNRSKLLWKVYIGIACYFILIFILYIIKG